MNFIIREYNDYKNISSLQLDMSFKNSNKNLNNIKDALKKFYNNKPGDYILFYEFKNDLLEINLKKTIDWVKDYNKITTMAYIYIYDVEKNKFLGVKSKSQSGYNNFLKLIYV